MHGGVVVVVVEEEREEEEDTEEKGISRARERIFLDHAMPCHVLYCKIWNSNQVS
jgi:hypothetical protein